MHELENLERVVQMPPGEAGRQRRGRLGMPSRSAATQPSRMSVLHVTEATGAGVLTYVTLLVGAQAAAGMTVSLLVIGQRPDRAADWKEQFPSQVRISEVPLQRGFGALGSAGLTGALSRLREIFRNDRPDVVHLHSSMAGGLGRLAAMGLEDVRVVYQPHGLSFLRRDLGPIARRLLFGCEWLLARTSAALVAVSAGEHAELRRLRTRGVHLVENGVDLAAIPVKRSDHAGLRIGTVGRICPQKDPAFFAAVAARLAGKGFEWVWVGDGDESLKARLLANAVSVTGWLPRADALAELACFDIFLQTSRWEGMPLSVIEAQVAGIPAVVRDGIGNREIIARTGGGVMMDSVESAANAILGLAGDASLRASLSAAARIQACQAYSFERIASEITTMYLGRAPAARAD